ncbi:glutathione S-transferase family protein [Phyllobacterium phragmitis]|uniref:glutathione S-transferase family protein n=1 Tax=Phyllobacterium phragmitis TaxID=2670329 RepID=UPI00130503E7|nr:glutathione S-transferase family protein [Phyllobacterium phragmitis]
MKLYNFPWGPYPRRLTLYLTEKGIADIELIEVEFPHQPELWPEDFLLKLSPAHSLPILDTGNGILIGQSIAILEYLEERYPSPNMLGETSEERARTRELVAIFDEATSFFGLWARQGSRVNAERHTPNAEAASIGAERFASKLRVGEAKFVGPFINGSKLTIADCVAMALIEFADQFYGVPVPADCGKLAEWYSRLSNRETMRSPRYPQDMLSLAYGLPEQTQIFL